MIFKKLRSLNDKLIAIISLCLFIQLLICRSLWFDNQRLYPKISVFENLEFAFLNDLGWLFFIILLCLLLFAIGKTNRFIVATFAGLVLLFILNDINRLQVWFYQLVAMLLVLLVSKQSDGKVTVKTLEIILISIYFWSGIHKLNVYFAEDTFPWLTEPFGLEQFALKNPMISWFVAIFETLIGIGLLFKKTRKIASAAGIILHLFILIVLSPFGHNWNHVVLPWNVCMIAFLYLLFYRNEISIFEKTLGKPQRFLPFAIIIILFGIMPFFNFFGNWDEQLSFKMYSGISPEGVFYYQNPATACISPEVKQTLVHDDSDGKTKSIILDNWAFHRLKIAPYKSKKRLMQVGKKLCRCIENPAFAKLVILEVDRWDTTNDLITTIPCLELLEVEK